MAKITLLGTGTCQLWSTKMASSILVELDKLRFLFDLGRGITDRLGELKLRQNDIEHLIFSHLHPDHTSDLIPFLHAACWSRIDPRIKDLHLYGPTGLNEFVKKIYGLFSYSSLRSNKYKVLVHEINSHQFQIDKYIFQSIDLPHTVNNRGLKFSFHNKLYAFTGDSKYCQQEIDFLKDCDFVVVDSGHLSNNQIVNVALLSRAKTIICSHQYDELDEKILNRVAKQKGYKGKVIVGQDLMSFSI